MNQSSPANAHDEHLVAMGAVQLLRNSLIIVTTTIAGYFLYQVSRNVTTVQPILLFLGLLPCAMGYRQLRAGQIGLGLRILIWGLWLAASVGSFIVAGIYTPALFSFPVFIMLIGWLQGHRQSIWMGALSIAVVLLLVYGIEAGWSIGAIRRTPREMLFAIVSFLVIATLLSSTLSESDKRQQAKERELKNSLQERLAELQRSEESVRVLNTELEQRVASRTAELSASLASLKQAQGELVEAEKLASLGALVAGVAHELNTPIGNAVTAASALQSQLTEIQKTIAGGELRRSTLTRFFEQGSEITALLERSCHRAAHLVASFKQVAVDRTSEHRRRFKLLALIEDIQATLRPTYKHATWAIVTEIDPDIECDSYPGPLGQIVTNLIQNAALHAFDGCPAGTLRISATASDNEITLQLADDGNGMDATTLARIFDPFFTTRLGQGGSGLGLSICRNIATAMLGGSLRADSEPGRGTRFTLVFLRQAPA